MDEDASIGLIGSGPAAAAIEAAVGDVDAESTSIDIEDAARAEYVAVVDRAGASAFERVNRVADGPWVAVELGGIGGRALPEVDAAVSVVAPDAGCFTCLRHRVAANLDDPVDAEPRTTRSDARLAGAVAGRLVAGLLTDGDPIGRVVELPYVERSLLPVPNCDCADVPDRALPREYAETTLEAAVDNADRAVDDRIGVVGSIGEAYSFPAPYYLATLCDTTRFSDAQASRQAAGVAADWNEAFMKAVGEALERYSAGVYREPSFTTAAAADLRDAVPPERFVRPGGFADPDPDEPIPWIAGEDLRTGEGVSLPAEFVQFPPPERRHKPPITTGLGLGSSGIEALLAGLYEVIERDATMLAWYSTFEPLGLDVDDPDFETLEKRARAEDLDATALLVTQDVDVPVVAAAVHREGDWPRFAVGSGADLDPDRAARSALAEAIQNWMELRGMGPEAAAEEGNIGRYADLPPDARAFVDAEGSVPAESVGPAEVPTGVDELAAVVDRVADAGLDAYAARITPRDVESLGFEAVRVLAPEAQPLFTEERYFGDRARQVPRDLGFGPRLDRAIHPYP